MRVGKIRLEAHGRAHFGDAFVEMLRSRQITAQSMAIERCLRLEFYGRFIMLARFVGAAEPFQRVGVVVVPIALTRAEPKRFPEMFRRLVDLVLNEQRTTKVGMRFGVVRVETESDVEFPNGIILLAGIL